MTEAVKDSIPDDPLISSYFCLCIHSYPDQDKAITEEEEEQ